MFSGCLPRALAACRVLFRSTRRFSAHLLVVLLVVSLVAPPAAPAVAAIAEQQPSKAASAAVPARDKRAAVQQEDEPDAGDPYATEPAGPPDPVPVIPAVPIAGLDTEADRAVPPALPQMMQAAEDVGAAQEELPVEDPLLPVLLEVTAERQIWASVPHAETADWINRPAYWGEGYTSTQYDALGRVTQTTAPNGEATTTAYSGRQTKVTGIGRNGYPNKVLRWTQSDGLGHLRYVWAANSSGGAAARVTLTHDVLGQSHAGGAAGDSDVHAHL